jgi:hypothetical protein
LTDKSNCCGGASASPVGNGFKEVDCSWSGKIPVYTELHSTDPLGKPITIPERAAQLLETAATTIRERGKTYNNDEVNYEDYRLNGMDATWQDILECFLRLWVCKKVDSAIDWVAYSALQAAFVEAGMPQSKFAPIFKKVIKGMA